MDSTTYSHSKCSNVIWPAVLTAPSVAILDLFGLLRSIFGHFLQCLAPFLSFQVVFTLFVFFGYFLLFLENFAVFGQRPK